MLLGGLWRIDGLAGCSGLSLTPTSTTSPASRISTLEVHPYFSLKTLVRDFSNKSVHKLSPTNTTAGQDATDAFYGLHRHEVLAKPAYQRLIIGRIVDEEPVIKMRELGAVSTVPYAEPTWLNDGFHSPYYKEVRIFSTFLLKRRSLILGF